MKNLYTAFLGLLFPFFLNAQIPDTFHLRGCAKFWANNQPIKNVEMHIGVDYTDQADASFVGTPSPDSLCSEATVTVYTAAPNAGFAISASKSDLTNDYRNGVSIADLVCINRHILGILPLSPAAQIAADANNSRSVTTFDIVELRNLLLGTYDELPNNSSWKFWPPYCPYPNPANPFQGYCLNFPFDSLPAFENHDIPLPAIKVGDVDGDYDFDGNYQPATVWAAIQISMPANQLIAGDTVWAPLYLNPGFDPDGVQFALRYDTALLQLVDLEHGPGSTPDNWGIFSSNGLLTHVGLYPYTGQTPLARFRFFVKTNGLLSSAIQLDDATLPAVYAYRSCGQMGAIELQFDAATKVETLPSQVFLSAPSPNPFSQHTTLRLQLERAEQVQLEVLDITGRRTYLIEGNYQPGSHQLEIPASAVPVQGLGVYRVSVGDRVFTGKIVRE